MSRVYRCASCGRTTSAEPVINCGIPLGDKDMVFSFCPRCWKKHKKEPPPITLHFLPLDIQQAVRESGVPVR